MLCDEQTLEALEFSRVRDRVIAETRTERGRRYAAQIEPSGDFDVVRREQARTEAARALLASADLHVGSAIDTEPYTSAAAQGRTLAPGELRAIAAALASAAAAFRSVREDLALRELVTGYGRLDDLRNTIEHAIDERGAVLDRASPALSRIRKSLKQALDESRERVTNIVRSARYAKIVQDTVVTIREGRLVVPIKAEFAGEFPGIVHDTSASGQTFFVEPLAALEANNRVRTLRIEEEREVDRILRELSKDIGERAGAVEANVEMLAHVDLVIAKAAVGERMRAVTPALEESASIDLLAARHPLLEEKAVAQSVALDERACIVVISGPNMGGKSVALRMVGLLVAMTYAGLQIPAKDGTRVGRFARVIADIGDEQSTAADASTFSAHLDRMRDLIAAANEGLLFLVDEIGTGTEPSAGAALAIATLEYLLTTGARGIVTTHSTELKLFAHATEGVANASVRFDPQTFAPTYHLDVGSPGQSFTFALAEARGVRDDVVARAGALLESGEREYERALEELAQRNAALEAEREALARQRKVEAEESAELAARADALRIEHERFVQRAEERLQRALRDFVGELQRRAPETRGRARLTPAQSALLSRTLDAMRQDLGVGPESASETPQRSVKLDLPLTGMQRRESSSSRSARFEAASNARSELDVRGKRYVEAEPLVDRWLDEAVLAGTTQLRLIHGKGTGMLGRGLQSFLRDHAAVASVRYGNEEEGSHGVTIIEVKG